MTILNSALIIIHGGTRIVRSGNTPPAVLRETGVVIKISAELLAITLILSGLISRLLYSIVTFIMFWNSHCQEQLKLLMSVWLFCYYFTLKTSPKRRIRHRFGKCCGLLLRSVLVTIGEQCNGIQWKSSERKQANIKILKGYWQLDTNCFKTQ